MDLEDEVHWIWVIWTSGLQECKGNFSFCCPAERAGSMGFIPGSEGGRARGRAQPGQMRTSRGGQPEPGIYYAVAANGVVRLIAGGCLFAVSTSAEACDVGRAEVAC